MRLGGVAASAGVAPAPVGSRRPGGMCSTHSAVGKRLGPAPQALATFQEQMAARGPDG